ncbi:hypothetical protein GCM10028810_06100 [Spirosoma litoris]
MATAAASKVKFAVCPIVSLTDTTEPVDVVPVPGDVVVPVPGVVVVPVPGVVIVPEPGVVVPVVGFGSGVSFLQLIRNCPEQTKKIAIISPRVEETVSFFIR